MVTKYLYWFAKFDFIGPSLRDCHFQNLNYLTWFGHPNERFNLGILVHQSMVSRWIRIW